MFVFLMHIYDFFMFLCVPVAKTFNIHNMLINIFCKPVA